MRCFPAIVVVAIVAAAVPVRGQCEELRFQHYVEPQFGTNGTPLYPGEELGIVVDGLPSDHFPIEITRVGFGLSYVDASPVDIRVYDAWPLPHVDPTPTYVHPGVSAQIGLNTVDVTSSSPMILAAQPFTVTVLGNGSITGAGDLDGCFGAPGEPTSVLHFLFVEPGIPEQVWVQGCHNSLGELIFWVEYRPAQIGTAMCLGDGSAVDCPCGPGQNGAPGAGCLHSSGSGAVLRAWGKPETSDDRLILVASELPQYTATIFFQYAATAPASPFGDGVLCSGGPLARLAGTITLSGVCCIGSSALPISVMGRVPSGGGTRYYQVWYRDFSAPWCTPNGSNLTSGLRIEWLP